MNYNLSNIEEVLELVDYDYYTNTSFLLKDKFSEDKVEYIDNTFTELFELVFEKLRQYKYTHPPFHEENVGDVFKIYIKINYVKYIIISQYGNAIRKYSMQDIENKEALFYLDMNTKDKSSEVKLMGTGWYY